MKNILGVLVILLLQGCNGLALENFRKSPYSLVTGNRSGLLVETGDMDWSGFPLLKRYRESSGDFRAVVAEECSAQKTLVAPELIPVAAAVGKLLFDLHLEREMKQMEALKRAAVASYSNRVIVSAEQLAAARCLLVTRYRDSADSPGLVAVLKVVSHGSAFTLRPVYVRARDTAALTSIPAAGQQAKIDLAFAVSLKTVGKSANGLPGLFPFGEGTVSVASVDVGPEGKAACLKGCGESDLVPYLAVKGQPLSISVAVTEAGFTGVDIDARVAEMHALKEALGPVVRELIESTLKK